MVITLSDILTVIRKIVDISFVWLIFYCILKNIKNKTGGFKGALKNGNLGDIIGSAGGMVESLWDFQGAYANDKWANELVRGQKANKEKREKLRSEYDDIKTYLSEYVNKGDLILTLGAGYVTKLADLLVNKEGSNGDAVDMSDEANHLIIEIKGSSADKTSAPNSFSPSEQFDDLVFVRLEKYDDLLKIYRTGINSEKLKSIKVNVSQTVEDQQKQGRRPRFSIQDKIVDELGLEPDAIFYIRDRKIEKKK